MVDHKDSSGQVILTSAILLAIIIVIVALMLNNIIYATNVAYIGFMDGSKYEDLSIRQLTINEATRAIYEDSNDGTTIATTHMSDYLKQLNYLTNSKGKYIEISTLNPLPPTAMGTVDTRYDLRIINKDSTVNYAILTGDPAVSGTTYTPPTVSFRNMPTSVTEGTSVLLQVHLSNPYDSPIVVNYVITPISPTVSSDYTSSPSSLTFNAGDQDKYVTITANKDNTYNNNVPKNFEITLNPELPADITPASATLSIVDIDQDPSVPATPQMTIQSITASRPAGGNDKKDVTVTLTVQNTGSSQLTNVQFALTVTPTDEKSKNTYTITSGQSFPATIDGNTIVTYTWVVKTQNENDKINIMAQGTATGVSGTVSSALLTGY